MTYVDYIQVWVILVWNSWVDTSMKYLHGIVEVWIQVGIYLYEIFNVQVWDTYTGFFDVQVWDTYTRFLMFEFATQLDRFSYALLNPAKTFSMN